LASRNEFYTVKEIAEMTGTDTATIYGDIRQGRLKGARNLTPYPPCKQEKTKHWPILVAKSSLAVYLKTLGRRLPKEPTPSTAITPVTAPINLELSTPLRAVAVFALQNFLQNTAEAEREDQGLNVLLEAASSGVGKQMRDSIKMHFKKHTMKFPKERLYPEDRLHKESKRLVDKV
jgi:hypothetical protein